MPTPSDAEQKARGLRALTITAAFSTFLAIVVFVIGTEYFVIPRQLLHHEQLQSLEARVEALQEKVDALEAKAAEPPPAPAIAPAAAAAAVPAMAPAPAPAAK